MFDFLKSIFIGEIETHVDECLESSLCNSEVWNSSCFGTKFNYNKNTILLIDDNQTVMHFLKEDLRFLDETGVISLDEYNVIAFTGKLAAFNFFAMQKKAKGLNITHAIIDLEYNGSIVRSEENVKMTGVDVYQAILEFNRNVNFVFLSNKLNKDLRIHKRIIQHFKDIKGNIFKYIIDKTNMSIRRRRAELSERLFSKDLSRIR